MGNLAPEEVIGEELLAICKDENRKDVFKNLKAFFERGAICNEAYLTEALFILKIRLFPDEVLDLLITKGANRRIKNAFNHRRGYYAFAEEHKGFYRGKCSVWRARDRVIMKRILKELGNPQDKIPPVLHITGSNGKGSVCGFLGGILEAQGYKVHKFQTPALINTNEMITLAGEVISDEKLILLTRKVIKTYFKIKDDPKLIAEIKKADELDASRGKVYTDPVYENMLYWCIQVPVMFLAFASVPADFSIIEVIVGGKNDFTNVIKPKNTLATVLTHIEYGIGSNDGTMPKYHNDGTVENSTVAACYHKANLGKPGIPMIAADQEPDGLAEIRRVARDEVKTETFEFNRDWFIKNETKNDFTLSIFNKEIKIQKSKTLIGDFQTKNIATAASTLLFLREAGKIKLDLSLINDGIQKTEIPARPQRVYNSFLNKFLGSDVEILAGVIKLNSRGVQPFEEVLEENNDYTNYFIYTASGRVQKHGTGALAFIEKYFNDASRLVLYEYKEFYRGSIEKVREILNEENIKFTYKNSLSSALTFVKNEIKNAKTKARVILCCESMINMDKKIYYFSQSN
ncbi:MAG: hypothetical protein LBM01_04075 [Christensenellaceae bacterium]|jgi:folylpolyglutamate synthase/dihydrofolate synthase|nr:hypothetical protein [Christensenellaceae bacterium]